MQTSGVFRLSLYNKKLWAPPHGGVWGKQRRSINELINLPVLLHLLLHHLLSSLDSLTTLISFLNLPSLLLVNSIYQQGHNNNKQGEGLELKNLQSSLDVGCTSLCCPAPSQCGVVSMGRDGGSLLQLVPWLSCCQVQQWRIAIFSAFFFIFSSLSLSFSGCCCCCCSAAADDLKDPSLSLSVCVSLPLSE